MYVHFVYCPSCHEPEMVDGAFKGEIQCNQDPEYSDKSGSGGVYDPAAGQWDIDVEVCFERCNNKRSIRHTQNDTYDLCILGIHAYEFSFGTSCKSSDLTYCKEDEQVGEDDSCNPVSHRFSIRSICFYKAWDWRLSINEGDVCIL